MATRKSIRLLLLLVIAANSIMADIAFFMYPPLRKIPGSSSYIFELEIMLALYIFVAWMMTRPNQPGIQKIIGPGLFFGLTGAGLEIVHISIENYGHLPARAESISTGIFMAVLAVIFGIAGFYGSKQTKDIKSGMITGAWSIMICMLLVSAYGLSQLFWGYKAIRQHDIGSPDFLRTGWTDFDAFVIADILEACFKVLFFGPFMGAFFGLIGGAIAVVTRSRNTPPQDIRKSS